MAVQERPNVILVFPDQMGATWLGCYGHPDVRTPNIDRFAGEGLLFERAYTATPICTPFRSTLLTGRYPCQTGVVENGQRIPHSEVTLAELFNRGGYHTAYIGKWHLSGPPGGNRWVPHAERAGFETFIGWESHHVDHWAGLIWGDDPVHPISMPGHETDALTDVACDVLGSLEPPFCLFVAYQAPHPPCTPPVELLDLYQGQHLATRPNVTNPQAWYRRPEWGCDYGMRTFVERHYGEISHFDRAFGRLTDRIRNLGRDDDTIVLLTSDHGEMAGCHGLFGKGVMYQEATHIPLIVRHPGCRPGVRTPALFSSVDFLPTLLDLCGLPPAPTAEGISYSPLIRGHEQTGRPAVYVQYRDLCTVRGSHKLVTDRDARQATALYDLAADPYEQENLVRDAEQQGIVQELQHELRAWLEDVQSRTGDVREASLPSPALEQEGHRRPDSRR
jgi:arylsulfatase A-like enzyme